MTEPPLPDFEGQVPEEEDERRRKRAGWWWWGERGIFLLVLALALAILGLIGLDRSADDSAVVGSPPTVPSQPVVTPTPSATPTLGATTSPSPSDTAAGVGPGTDQRTVTAAPVVPGQQRGPSTSGRSGTDKTKGKDKGKGKGKGRDKGKDKGKDRPKKPKPPKCKRPGKPPCKPKPTPKPTPTPTPTPTVGRCPTGGSGPQVGLEVDQLLCTRVVSGGMALAATGRDSVFGAAGPGTASFDPNGTAVSSGRLLPLLVADQRGSTSGWSLTLSARTSEGVHVVVDPWCYSVADLSAPGLFAGGPGQLADRAASLCVKNDEVGWSFSTSGTYMVGGDFSVVGLTADDTEPVVVTMLLA